MYCLKTETLERASPWLPFFIQGLVLPLIVVLAGASLYDRLRHLFFMAPPLCLLAGFGLYFSLTVSEMDEGRRRLGWRGLPVSSAPSRLL